MPIYEYQCASNGRVVEVRHKMNESLRTWGELCERAGVAAGGTDPRAAVVKLISAGYLAAGSPAPAESVCGSGACGSGACAGGGCGGGFCEMQ
ncbi:MAG TPA: hypothetical protein VMU86_07710 [Steroidobacteraceae bacterium]|nr:hypothetical protein [Steroidobacteraceae bacterium]